MFHMKKMAAGKESVGSLESRATISPYVLNDLASAGVLVKAVQAGLPFAELTRLQSGLGIPLDRLAPKLGLSKSTLHRRQAQGRLDPAESDRVMRFSRLLAQAVELFEDQEIARRWLASPQIGLGGAVPLDYAETEIGAREVEDLLGRIAHGVYS